MTISSKVYFQLFLLIVSALCEDPSKIDWCSVEFECKMRPEKQNYACTGCPLAENCVVMKDLMTPGLREKMLAAHNELRDKVASGKENKVPEKYRKGASNMRALSYDSSLEYLAECWLRKCKFAHTPCSSIKKFPNVGQNLYMTTADCNEENIISGIKTWYESEIELVNPPEVYEKYKSSSDPSIMWGHYTQVIWAETEKVGCSVSKNTQSNSCFLACNYATAGNFLEKPVYDWEGGPATKCSSSSKPNKQYKGLCGEIEKYDNVKWTIDGKAPDKSQTADQNANANKEQEKKNDEVNKDDKDDKNNNEIDNSLNLPWIFKQKESSNEKNETENISKIRDLPWIFTADEAKKNESPPPISGLPWIVPGNFEDDRKVLSELTDLPWKIFGSKQAVSKSQFDLPAIGNLPWIIENGNDTENEVDAPPVISDLPWIIKEVADEKKNDNERRRGNNEQTDEEGDTEVPPTDDTVSDAPTGSNNDTSTDALTESTNDTASDAPEETTIAPVESTNDTTSDITESPIGLDTPAVSDVPQEEAKSTESDKSATTTKVAAEESNTTVSDAPEDAKTAVTDAPTTDDTSPPTPEAPGDPNV